MHFKSIIKTEKNDGNEIGYRMDGISWSSRICMLGEKSCRDLYPVILFTSSTLLTIRSSLRMVIYWDTLTGTHVPSHLPPTGCISCAITGYPEHHPELCRRITMNRIVCDQSKSSLDPKLYYRKTLLNFQSLVKLKQAYLLFLPPRSQTLFGNAIDLGNSVSCKSPLPTVITIDY